MIGRIIRLPLKLIAMPAALALFLCHAACAIVIGIGSMVTSTVSKQLVALRSSANDNLQFYKNFWKVLKIQCFRDFSYI